MPVTYESKTGQKLTITYWSMLWSFLFGPLYFLYMGLVAMFFVYAILCVFTHGWALLFVPLIAPKAMADYCERMGWKKI